MNTEPIGSLTNRIMNRYNKQPVGWNVLMDFKGNVLILGPKEGYMLKLVPINPQEHLSVGMEIQNPHELRKLADRAPPYGFRPLSSRHAEDLLHSFHHAEKQSKLISELLESTPRSLQELEKTRPTAMLRGPIITHPNLSSVSKHQRELEAKLTIEAEKLFRKKYPSRAALYR